jgi:hypothetical protein
LGNRSAPHAGATIKSAAPINGFGLFRRSGNENAAPVSAGNKNPTKNGDGPNKKAAKRRKTMSKKSSAASRGAFLAGRQSGLQGCLAWVTALAPNL